MEKQNKCVVEFEDDDGKRTCIVCLDEKVSKILDPCRHACLCTACCKLISNRGAVCPLCEIVFTKTITIGESENPPIEIPKETLEKYMMTREDFIKKLNLTVTKEGSDLVIRGHIIDGYFISCDTAREVFIYYLGTTRYNSHMKTSFSSGKPKMNMETISAAMKANPNLSFNDIFSNLPTVALLTFHKFFDSVGPDVVTSEKLCKHLIDNYFQDYLEKKVFKI